MKISTEGLQAQVHLCRIYPALADTLRTIGPLTIDVHEDILVAEALTSIVIGQMLSTKAARSIYRRIKDASRQGGYEGSWKLDPETLASFGLSRRKVRTIKEFGHMYDSDPESFEAWRYLAHDELTKLVSNHWGLSKWSADMLAIFYFGLPDVFPIADRTINCAIDNLQAANFIPKHFDSANASPYRTYFSLYLWKMVDTKLLAFLT